MVSVKLNSISDYQSFKSKMSLGIPGILSFSTTIKEAAGSTTAGGTVSVSYFKVAGQELNNNLMALSSESANTFSFGSAEMDQFLADFNTKFDTAVANLNDTEMFYRIPRKGDKVFVSNPDGLGLKALVAQDSGFTPIDSSLIPQDWLDEKYKENLKNYKTLVEKRGNSVGQIFNTLFKARNDKARLMSLDFQDWLNNNNNSELASKIKGFYIKYDSVIANDNYFSAMKQIDSNDHSYPGAEVIRKCYSNAALIDGVSKNPLETIDDCESAVEWLNQGANNIVADYKNLADSLIGYKFSC